MGFCDCLLYPLQVYFIKGTFWPKHATVCLGLEVIWNLSIIKQIYTFSNFYYTFVVLESTFNVNLEHYESSYLT